MEVVQPPDVGVEQGANRSLPFHRVLADQGEGGTGHRFGHPEAGPESLGEGRLAGAEVAGQEQDVAGVEARPDAAGFLAGPQQQVNGADDRPVGLEDGIVTGPLISLLEHDGHHVLLAEDGAEAWELFRNGDCRMVVSGWRMPAMDCLELTRRIADACPVPLVASGGVGELDHLVEGAVVGAADAVLAASIFHLGEFTVAEAKEHLAAAGVPVRPVVGRA